MVGPDIQAKCPIVSLDGFGGCLSSVNIFTMHGWLRNMRSRSLGLNCFHFSWRDWGFLNSDSQGIAFDIFTRCFAFDYLRPFAYSKNGNIVLIYDGCCKLYWYNLKDLGFEHIELPGRPEHFREVTLCVDSPVPLDAGTGMGVQRSE